MQSGSNTCGRRGRRRNLSRSSRCWARWAGGSEGIDWVIVGGESGPSARPMAEAGQSKSATGARADGVAFFFKQWGGVRPKSGGRLLEAGSGASFR